MQFYVRGRKMNDDVNSGRNDDLTAMQYISSFTQQLLHKLDIKRINYFVMKCYRKILRIP